MSDFIWSIPDVVSIAAPTLPAARTQIDHVAAGLARLPEQFRKPNIIALLTIFLSRFNDLELAYQALLTMRQIGYGGVPGTAFGAQLDALGKLVGQDRGGLVDADYMRYISARIAANNSDGTVEDLISVARLVLNDALMNVQVITTGPAAVIVRVIGDPVSSNLASILIDMLRVTHSAGVRLIQESIVDTEVNTFHFALTCFTTAGRSHGDTSIPVDMTTNFPASGSLVLDVGGGNQETVTYGSVDATHFLNCSPIQFAHGSTVQVDAVTQLGKGFGDSTEGITTTPYSNIGTTGGRLIDARE